MKAILTIKEVLANIERPDLFNPTYNYQKLSEFIYKNIPNSFMLESHKEHYVFQIVDSTLKKQTFNSVDFYLHESNKFACFKQGDSWIIKIQNKSEEKKPRKRRTNVEDKGTESSTRNDDTTSSHTNG